MDQWPVITFLRDPVKRLKSYLQYLNAGKTHYVRPGGIDVQRFLEEDYAPTQNMQIRVILGVRGYDLPALDDAALVARAIEILENQLAGFGITERFDDSLLLLRRALGWRKYPVYIRLNETGGGDGLVFTEAQEARMRELNQLDIRFYEAARQLFLERVQACSADLDQDRVRFASRQKIAAPLLQAYQLYHRISAAAAFRKWHGRGAGD